MVVDENMIFQDKVALKKDLIIKSRGLFDYKRTVLPRHKLMNSYCVSGLTLDVGCVSKPNVVLENVIGCDIVDDFDHLPSNYVGFLKFDVDDGLPFGKYDNILAGELIEHLSNPFKFLSDCYSSLNVGGRLIVTTVNSWYFYRFFPKEEGVYNDHVIEFDYVTLKRLFSKVGFEIVVCRGVYVKLPFISRIKCFERLWCKNLLFSTDFIIVGRKLNSMKKTKLMEN